MCTMPRTMWSRPRTRSEARRRMRATRKGPSSPRRTASAGGVARSEYDPEGNPAREIRKDGTAVTTTYDALDRIVRITEPLGLRTSYEYDGNGNLVRHTDPNGRQPVRAYADADRLIRVTDALGVG